jgi:hypothetical protein
MGTAQQTLLRLASDFALRGRTVILSHGTAS